ncbi:DUF1566 domain-containing protein [candidate division KSB1 bacterium]|nr:DUF1566 domain-containing protein [candidate division KSB1 bacterium]
MLMLNKIHKINVKNPNDLPFRSRSTALTKRRAIDIIRKYDFYDAKKNPRGKGFSHRYALQLRNGNKIVIDEETNLMWQKGGYTYKIESKDSKKCIKELNQKCFAGYNDWRLPTLEEAMSLVEPRKSDDGLHIDPVFDKKQNWIWTSDSYNNRTQAWYVTFLDGSCGYMHLFNYGYDYVRAVRSLH